VIRHRTLSPIAAWTRARVEQLGEKPPAAGLAHHALADSTVKGPMLAASFKLGTATARQA
jgi:hypothetical protein